MQEWLVGCVGQAERLLNTVKTIEHTFTDEEKRRNSNGESKLFVGKDDPLHPLMVQLQNKYRRPPCSLCAYRSFTMHMHMPAHTHACTAWRSESAGMGRR